MNRIASFVLAGALIVPSVAQQPQPQTPQKTDNPCAPRQESNVERQAKTRTSRIFGGVLNKANQTIQKSTKGNAPVITPNDLPTQAQKPCKAPAASPSPTN